MRSQQNTSKRGMWNWWQLCWMVWLEKSETGRVPCGTWSCRCRLNSWQQLPATVVSTDTRWWTKRNAFKPFQGQVYYPQNKGASRFLASAVLLCLLLQQHESWRELHCALMTHFKGLAWLKGSVKASSLDAEFSFIPSGGPIWTRTFKLLSSHSRRNDKAPAEDKMEVCQLHLFKVKNINITQLWQGEKGARAERLLTAERSQAFGNRFCLIETNVFFFLDMRGELTGARGEQLTV